MSAWMNLWWSCLSSNMTCSIFSFFICFSLMLSLARSYLFFAFAYCCCQKLLIARSSLRTKEQSSFSFQSLYANLFSFLATICVFKQSAHIFYSYFLLDSFKSVSTLCYRTSCWIIASQTSGFWFFNFYLVELGGLLN